MALKGLGVVHLACVAADERAVAALRARKHSEDEPFALMVPTWMRPPRWSRSGGEERRAAGLARAADRDATPLAGLRAGERAAGLEVLVPERLPPGDGGIAYGQASIAAVQSG